MEPEKVANRARTRRPNRRLRAIASGRRDEAAAWRVSTGEDLELALRAAERLLAQAEARHRHGQNVTIGLYSTMVGVGLSFVASIVISARALSYNYGDTSTVVAASTTVLTFGVLVAATRALFVQRQRMYMDYTLRIATQLSSIIDEVLVEVAERERWSQFRIEATKLRLSVFPAYNYYQRERSG